MSASTDLKVLVKVAVLAAISYILLFIAIPLPFMPPFLKIDLSDVPALLAAFSLGPLSAVFVELVKNLLHLLNSETVGIGELANFLVGVAMIVPAGIIYKKKKNRTTAILSLLAGTLVMAVCAAVLNYFVFIPLYAKFLGFSPEFFVSMGREANNLVVDLRSLVLYAIVPFNIIKGMLISTVIMLIYKKVAILMR